MVLSTREIEIIWNDIESSREFSRLRELFSQLEKKWIEMYLEDSRSYELVLPYAVNSFVNVVTKLRDFSSKWKYGEIDPETKELEAAEKLTEFLFSFSKGMDEKDFPEGFGENFLSEAKEFLSSLKSRIKEEIKRRENPNPDNPNPEDSEDSSGNSRLDYEIKELKDRIKNLKRSLQETSNLNFKQHYRKKIRELRKELVEKREEKLNTKKGNFPTKLVLISVGVGAVIILLLVALYSQLSRRNQRY